VRPAPLARSYWASEGRLLAGGYPLGEVVSLIDAGMLTVIDLTEHDELGLRTRRDRDYGEQLEGLGLARRVDVRRYRFPIEDVDVPTHTLLAEILDTIDAELEADRPVYVHCWGGYGRTGVVVGAWLIRHALATPDDFVERIAERRTHLSDHVPSPQTDEQVRFVRAHAASGR